MEDYLTKTIFCLHSFNSKLLICNFVATKKDQRILLKSKGGEDRFVEISWEGDLLYDVETFRSSSFIPPRNFVNIELCIHDI